MYKTHVKLQPAEGPAKFTFTSYTDQFKYDAERGNFDTYKTWYTELNKWSDHLTDVDKVELIELQKKLQQKFVSDDRMKAKHHGWKCQRKDNDCEVPIRMRKFMLGLDKEIRKKLKEGLDIPQRSSAIDFVSDIINMGLVKPLQRFVLFWGDIRQNIHHITQFIKFCDGHKDVISKSFTPVTGMPDIRDMPLENTEDVNSEAFKKARKLVQSYMAWEMSFLEPAEGRFLSAEPGAHSPLVAHMLFGNPVGYIFTSLLGLIGTFARFSAIVIAILCLVAWLCPTKGREPTSQTPTFNNAMEPWIQEEQDMQQRRRVHEIMRSENTLSRDDLVEQYGNYPEYAALSKKYYGVIPLSELRKLDVNDEDNKKKKEEIFKNFADYWEGTCPICLLEMEKMEDANNVKCCNCGHSFHKDCINEWILTANTCPTCRRRCGEGLVLGEIGETLKTLVAKKTKREAEKREQQRDEKKKKEVEKAKTKREDEQREQQRDEKKKKEVEKAKREYEQREYERSDSDDWDRRHYDPKLDGWWYRGNFYPEH